MPPRRSALFGTVDSWLLWNLTGGAKGVGSTTRHVTDVTNASRTMLMDLSSCTWHDDSLRALGLAGLATAEGSLPQIVSSAEVLGHVADGGPCVSRNRTGDPQAARLPDPSWRSMEITGDHWRSRVRSRVRSREISPPLPCLSSLSSFCLSSFCLSSP